MARYFDETDRLLGRDPPAHVDPGLAHLGVAIPEAVHAWYARSDALEVLAACSNSDHPIAPPDMTLDASREPRVIPFLNENQGVCRWAFELTGDDPQVVVSVDRGPWVSTRCSFSQFVWCQVFDWETTWSEDMRELGGDPPDERALRFLRDHFREGPSNYVWGSAITRRFYSDRVRITIRPSWLNGDGRADWIVSTRTFADLDRMLDMLAPFYDEEA